MPRPPTHSSNIPLRTCRTLLRRVSLPDSALSTQDTRFLPRARGRRCAPYEAFHGRGGGGALRRIEPTRRTHPTLLTTPSPRVRVPARKRKKKKTNAGEFYPIQHPPRPAKEGCGRGKRRELEHALLPPRGEGGGRGVRKTATREMTVDPERVLRPNEARSGSIATVHARARAGGGGCVASVSGVVAFTFTLAQVRARERTRASRSGVVLGAWRNCARGGCAPGWGVEGGQACAKWVGGPFRAIRCVLCERIEWAYDERAVRTLGLRDRA
ncbi:hypothetical protein BC628DRAFT_541887 [Trametes gibbosa]|nr:hypothetical protein BC628DRAFT_541887 [Trametes gibbosa]